MGDDIDIQQRIDEALEEKRLAMLRAKQLNTSNSLNDSPFRMRKSAKGTERKRR